MFTGHRASKLPWKYDEEDERCRALKKKIAEAVENAYKMGFHHFICGMADGGDTYFCEAVLDLRSLHSDVTIEAAVPFAGQSDFWAEDDRERYHRLLSRCDFATILQEQYSAGCMMRRNRYMVDHSQLVIGYYTGGSGGTINTLRYASRLGREIILI